MNIELYSLLSTVIFLVTGGTVVLAVFAYLLFRVRERRAAQRAHQRLADEPAPQFFRRYDPESDYEVPQA